MSIQRASLAVLGLALIAACSGGGPTTAPATTAPSLAPGTGAPQTSAPTSEPTTAPATTAPSASLDPSQSDAGVAARVTITNDTRNGLDGTHDIYGVADDGSECSGAFEDNYTVVAWYDEAPNGMIRRFGVSVAHDEVPAEDGTTSDIEDGSVSFDFTSESGFGTTYTGAATRENQGSSTIDVTRAGSTLTFDFEGVTWDGINFSGQFLCANVEG